MPTAEDRKRIIDALTRAWNETVPHPDYGQADDRLDQSSQREHLVRSAMELIWAVQRLDEQTSFDEITLTGAPAEGLRNTAELGTFRVLIESVAKAAEAVLGQQVRRTRALGVPWNKIGPACGMTAQGIYKKATQHNWVSFLDNPDPE